VVREEEERGAARVAGISEMAAIWAEERGREGKGAEEGKGIGRVARREGRE
jgi:hypothetical protein